MSARSALGLLVNWLLATGQNKEATSHLLLGNEGERVGHMTFDMYSVRTAVAASRCFSARVSDNRSTRFLLLPAASSQLPVAHRIEVRS